jgi:hypothetical protein
MPSSSGAFVYFLYGLSYFLCCEGNVFRYQYFSCGFGEFVPCAVGFLYLRVLGLSYSVSFLPGPSCGFHRAFLR